MKRNFGKLPFSIRSLQKTNGQLPFQTIDIMGFMT